MRHGAQYGGAEVTAGGLAIVPSSERRRVQPVVVLRDDLLRQLRRVPVVVLALYRQV